MASPNPNRLSVQLSTFEATSSSGRQSPFRRQNSQSPGTTAYTGTPDVSPTKSSFAPSRATPLSPVKASPFVRRPSQINASERPLSPLVRPASSLSLASLHTHLPGNVRQRESTPERSAASPTSRRQQSVTPAPEDSPGPASPGRQPSPISAGEQARPSTARKLSSPLSHDGARRSAEQAQEESPFASRTSSPTALRESLVNLRPTTERNMSSSTTATIKPAPIKQPVFTTQPKMATPKLHGMMGGAYHHIPQPLLHSMRESFEVLDSGNTGSVESANVADMLAQMGLGNSAAALKDFFPPNGPSHLNLARYLDMLSAPLADLSQPDELRAAFEAFDVDDSGQIDVGTLREALLHTVPQPGEDITRLGARDVDRILGEFTGRRAFGSKGLQAGKTKGEVFRYRDFIANVSCGGANGGEMEAAQAA